MKSREEEEGVWFGAERAVTDQRGWTSGAAPLSHWLKEEPLPGEAGNWRRQTSVRGARGRSRAVAGTSAAGGRERARGKMARAAQGRWSLERHPQLGRQSCTGNCVCAGRCCRSVALPAPLCEGERGP